MQNNNVGGFKAYMNEALPGYKNFLDDEQISNLRELYLTWEKHDRIASKCLNMHLHSVVGVDYSTDFEKHMDIASRSINALKKSISNIRKVYGFDKEDTTLAEKKYI